MQMQHLLPEHTTVTEIYCNLLPAGAQSAVYPFSGAVINFNVTTRCHRDSKDETFCLIMAIQDCEGGELGLVEPGLVVRMVTGDLLLFRSPKTTHFNLHFKGKRCSIVFHCDREGQSWVKDRNGWASKTYFSV